MTRLNTLIKLAGYLKYRKPAIEKVEGVLKDSKGKVLGAIKKPVTIKHLPSDAKSMSKQKAKRFMTLTDREKARVNKDVREKLKGTHDFSKKVDNVPWASSTFRKVI